MTQRHSWLGYGIQVSDKLMILKTKRLKLHYSMDTKIKKLILKAKSNGKWPKLQTTRQNSYNSSEFQLKIKKSSKFDTMQVAKCKHPNNPSPNSGSQSRFKYIPRTKKPAKKTVTFLCFKINYIWIESDL